MLSCNKHSIKLPKTVIFTFVSYLPPSSETTMATQEKTTQEQSVGWGKKASDRALKLPDLRMGQKRTWQKQDKGTGGK